MDDGRVKLKDLMFRHPFNMIVGGASGSGKTQWVCKFLDGYKRLIDPKPVHVLYCYGVYNDRVIDLQKQGVET